MSSNHSNNPSSFDWHQKAKEQKWYKYAIDLSWVSFVFFLLLFSPNPNQFDVMRMVSRQMNVLRYRTGLFVCINEDPSIRCCLNEEEKEKKLWSISIKSNIFQFCLICWPSFRHETWAMTNIFAEIKVIYFIKEKVVFWCLNVEFRLILVTTNWLQNYFRIAKINHSLFVKIHYDGPLKVQLSLHLLHSIFYDLFLSQTPSTHTHKFKINFFRYTLRHFIVLSSQETMSEIATWHSNGEIVDLSLTTRSKEKAQHKTE